MSSLGRSKPQLWNTAIGMEESHGDNGGEWIQVARRGQQRQGNGGQTYARKDEHLLRGCQWRRFWVEKKRFTVTHTKEGGVVIQESARGRHFSVTLDNRELDWVQRILKGTLVSRQLLRRSYRADAGNLYIQTLENHIGKVLRLWRATQNGWNAILIPYDNGKGWESLDKAIYNGGQPVKQQDDDQRPPHREATHRGNQPPSINTHHKGNHMNQRPKVQGVTVPCVVVNEPQGTQPIKDWHLAVVVFKAAPTFSWNLLEFVFGAGLGRSISLQPFGEDRAILLCCSVEEKSQIINQGKLIGGALIDKIESWAMNHHADRCLVCTNEWICIEGLPLNFWHSNLYQAIGLKFGGLLQVAQCTQQKQMIGGAWLKVKGNPNQFYPAKSPLRAEDFRRL